MSKFPGFLDWQTNTGVVQACCRSLIVDTLPIPAQQAGSAWGMLAHDNNTQDIWMLNVYSHEDVGNWSTHWLCHWVYRHCQHFWHIDWRHSIQANDGYLRVVFARCCSRYKLGCEGKSPDYRKVGVLITAIPAQLLISEPGILMEKPERSK